MRSRNQGASVQGILESWKGPSRILFPDSSVRRALLKILNERAQVILPPSSFSFFFLLLRQCQLNKDRDSSGRRRVVAVLSLNRHKLTPSHNIITAVICINESLSTRN